MDKTEIAENIYKMVNCQIKCDLAELMQDNLKGIFIILKVLNEKHGEMTAGSIAQTLGVSTSRVAVALKTLENKHYIEKFKSLDDARCTIVQITEQGIIALNQREKQIISTINKVLEKLTDSEAVTLKNIIEKLTH